ncbi:MAG: mechanosensitive ion channel family protein, partial [Planctomycetota bacterium]
TIPISRLISDNVKNWRGMSESGGRRIKRALAIDQNTIRFLSADEVERFAAWDLLRDYISTKRSELSAANGERDGVASNARQLTNIGTLRAYIQAYLRARSDIHTSGMTFLVRQLPPGSQGLPIEIYVFTTTTNWIEYEAIQADIFDHLLASLSEFDLRGFQQPTGADLARLAGC